MALGAKLIAATLILGASTVGTYAIANGGLGGLSSEGDSSTSAEETGTQKAVPEAPVKGEGSANTGESAGVRIGQESAPNTALPPQTQSQPVQEDAPVAKDNEATVNNQVTQGGRAKEGKEQVERVESAGNTAVTLSGTPGETPPSVDPAPEALPDKGPEETGPKGDVQEQSTKVVSNVEAEVASDTGHNSAGATSQQPASGGQGSNLEGTSHTSEPASGEEQHRSTDVNGGVKEGPESKQEGNGGDPSKGIKAEEAQDSGNTDPNKNPVERTDGGSETEKQDKGASSQLETTSPKVDDSHTSSNQADNGQEVTSLGTQNDHNTSEN